MPCTRGLPPYGAVRQERGLGDTPFGLAGQVSPLGGTISGGLEESLPGPPPRRVHGSGLALNLAS
eukprot:3462311-Pyramimonas_sp.AAC.1